MIRLPASVLAATTCVLGLAAFAPAVRGQAEEAAWPSPVEGFQAPEPGEHPRLLFRRADLPALRERARTPEGQAILRRLREVLNGDDGRTLPGNMGRGTPTAEEFFPQDVGGTFSISHVAGYGLLYQVTGDRHYADLGRRAMEAALAGARGGDNRYSFRNPSGPLRAGPSLGWYALGYDLCYDGWDEAFRRQVATAIATYDEGSNMSLPALVRGARLHPRSNHWGMQVGGGAMALLAVMDDPGVDMERLRPLFEVSRRSMIRNLTEGFGDGLYFAEGDGTITMSSHIVFLPALQAWRTAGGQDFITPRPNAQWASLRWLLGTVVHEGRPHFHSRDGYAHNVWQRHSISGGGYFGIGFGVATEPQQAAWRWAYQRFFLDHDLTSGTPYDTAGQLPHHSVLAFVNWPLDIEPVNPAQVIPRAAADRAYGYAMFRNRWQDENDIVITVLAQRARGHTNAAEIGPVWITANAAGERWRLHPRHATTALRDRPDASWGRMEGEIRHFAVSRDGSAVLTTADGTSLAVDFSGNAGVEGMLVMTGPGAPDDATSVTVGGRPFRFLFLDPGADPAPRVEGDRAVVGRQAVSLQDGNLVLHNIAPPWDGPTPVP